MSEGLSIPESAQARRRTVQVRLPDAAWEFLGHEADFRNATLSAQISDMILCALRVQGYRQSREKLTKKQQVGACKL